MTADRFGGKAAWFDEHYASVRGRVRLELVLERLRSVLPVPPARVLDVGGGTGAFAVPLAGDGHDVTLVDPSAEWLERARANAREAGVELGLHQLGLSDLTDAGLGSFEAILCHTVLMYVDAPAEGLRTLRGLVAPGGALSLLEKNRDGLALRPALRGNYDEAHRLLRERDSSGALGVTNRAYSVPEWLAMLDDAGWEPIDWAGVRLFSDHAPDDLPPDEYTSLLDLERAAGVLDPYRQLARLVHLTARAWLDEAEET
jgi:S-adenosylmethionine-dependent methyltransferase